MTVRELQAHFFSRIPWVNPNHTADRIEIGDPEKPVRKVGTGWSACTPNLRAAAADGCALYITHEPSFCEFWSPEAGFRETEWGRMRTRICEEAGMALMSLHDTWDNFPQWGIRDSWMQHLGIREADVIARRPYLDRAGESLGVYRVPPTTLDGYARFVAERIREFGMNGVVVMGDGKARVETVAIGVGCHIPEKQMMDLGADVLVQVFDRAFQTFTRLPLLDLGAKLIVVEHGCVEMPGMRNLAAYIAKTFSEIQTAFYRHEPDSRVVTAR